MLMVLAIELNLIIRVIDGETVSLRDVTSGHSMFASIIVEVCGGGCSVKIAGANASSGNTSGLNGINPVALNPFIIFS